MKTLRARQVWLGITAGLLGGLAHAGLLIALIGAGAVSDLSGTDLPGTGLAVHLTLSALMGVVYTWLFNPAPESHPESLMSGLVFGLVWWMILALNLIPILIGKGPQWQVKDVAPLFPGLVGYLLQGSAIGLGYHVFSDLTRSWLGALEESVEAFKPPQVRHRVVVLGGGFAGVSTAQHLERLFEKDGDVSLTLISNTNHLLFTPMLSEITAGGVEPRHISTALRAFFRRTQVIRGNVEMVNFTERVVKLATDGESTSLSVPFDHLVFALGAVPNFFGMRAVEKQAFTFKSLEDATELRNHAIEMLERADAESDPESRKALMTFIVAGGGFAGAELVGGLNDFVRGSLWFYPNVMSEEVSLILVHSGDRIMPELSSELAQYAYEKLKARGVTFKLRSRVKDTVPGSVILSTGEIIRAETLVWTAGNTPNPLIRELGISADESGAVKTETTLAVTGHSNVWALGDCAFVVDSRTGQRCPPTAQHALRQAAALASNIHAVIRGRKTKEFSYRPLGSFALLGYQTACAEIRGLKFSGLLAWWLWRTFYLLKLPSLEKKIRVALDWTADLFFPRDLVQTVSFRRAAKRMKAPR